MLVTQLENYVECHRDRIIGAFLSQILQQTKRNRGLPLLSVVSELRSYLLGWRGYFGFCQTPSVLWDFDSWIHRRLR